MLGFDALASLSLGETTSVNKAVAVISTESVISAHLDQFLVGYYGGSGSEEKRLLKVKRDQYHKKAYDDKVKRHEKKKRKAKENKKVYEAALEIYEAESLLARQEGEYRTRQYVNEMRSIIQRQRLRDEEDVIALLLAS